MYMKRKSEIEQFELARVVVANNGRGLCLKNTVSTIANVTIDANGNIQA